MTMIRLSSSQLHAARVLAGLSREEVAERAGLCRHSIRRWETSSDAVPAATYSHLCRALAVLEGEGARFSGDGVSALSGDSPDYLVEAVPPPSTPNDSKGLHLGMDLAARVRHAGICHASMSRSPDLRRSYDGAPPGCFSGR
jgi:transcriptional regulator with XRE-family HTH domain